VTFVRVLSGTITAVVKLRLAVQSVAFNGCSMECLWVFQIVGCLEKFV
jgi:hypothetical protein